MAPGRRRRHPTSRRAREEAELDQIGLVDVHHGIGVLGDGGCQRVKTDGASVESVNQGAQEPAVVLVQAERIDAQAAQRLLGDRRCDHPVGADFSEVAHTPQ